MNIFVKPLSFILFVCFVSSNAAITALNQRDTLTENTKSYITLKTSDDSAMYTYHIVSAPKNGTLFKGSTVMNSGDSAKFYNFYYTANSGFTSDSFTWQASNNGGTYSNIATFRIKIVPNTAPNVLGGKFILTYRDRVQIMPVPFSDPNKSQSYSVTVITQPSHGTISVLNGSQPSFRFNHDQGSVSFCGVDSFTWKMSDGFSETDTVKTEMLFRNLTDRAEMLVMLVVNDSIFPFIETEVARLRTDLETDGYTTLLRQLPRTAKAETLWNVLRREYVEPKRFMAGAILIGSLPTATNNQTAEPTDCVYWNMVGPFRSITNRNIWVSRISLQGLTLPRTTIDEVSRIKDALDANHSYRNGLSRLPWTGYWWALPEFLNCYPKKGATILEMLPDSQFLKPIDAIQKGGELLDETAHNATHGIGNLRYHPTQIRFVLLTSCGQAENAQEQIFGRGGGCVLSVGATRTTYTGAFQIVDHYGDSVFRYQLSAGESWGGALMTQYAFDDKYRAMFYGDLSLRMKMAQPNRVPVVTSINSDISSGNAPLSVNFTASASDPDGDQISGFEWSPCLFSGLDEPAQAGSASTFSYVYTVPHVYLPEVMVRDSYGAYGWLSKQIVVGPQPGAPVRINCGFPYTGSSALTKTYVPNGDYVDKDGKMWLHDQVYTEGTWGKVTNYNYLMLSGNVLNTEDDSIFLTYARDLNDRSGIKYKVPLENGKYEVRFGFADMSNTEPGARLMDIYMEDVLKDTSFDIVATFGAKTAGFISKTVDLIDGMLDITVKTNEASPTGTSGYALVNSIEILPENYTATEVMASAKIPQLNVYMSYGYFRMLYTGDNTIANAIVTIYNIRGQQVYRFATDTRELANGVSFGKNWANGNYFVKAKIGERQYRKSAVLVR